MSEAISVPSEDSTWSDWAPATEEERAHFNLVANHRAWSRKCTNCGEGDLVQRKHIPTWNYIRLAGRGFPKLPLPTLEANQRQPRFKTPTGRMHAC